MMIGLATVAGFLAVPLAALAVLFGVLAGSEYLLDRLPLGRGSRFALLLVKGLRRNPVRSGLTYLAVFVLVAVVVMIWSALYVLNHMCEERSRDIKIVITEKWQAVSEMPWAYARPLCEGAANPSDPDAVRPTDAMTWQFYLATTDPEKHSADDTIFFIALEPHKAATLMDRVFDDVPQESKQHSGPKLRQARDFMTALERMEKNKQGVILGQKQLKKLNKRVGERMKVTGITFKDIDLEVEIVGAFPEGRYDETAIMNRDYLNDALDLYPRTHGGVAHALAGRRLNLVVLQVPDMQAYTRVTRQIDSSGTFQDPPIRCETLSAYAVSQLDSYRDIIWGLRWLLAPAILFTMTLVIANSIGITVRERQKEIAVLKVLGYRPVQILGIVLGEALLLGTLSGLLSTALVYEAVNHLISNANSVLPVYVPANAFWWGPLVGLLTGLAGSFVPAGRACRVQASAVFARAT